MTAAGVRVRPARAEELDAVGALTVAGYATLASPPSAEYERVLRDAASRARDAELLVAEDAGGALVGTVTYVPGRDAPLAEFAGDDEAGLRMLAVDPAARGRGVATALVAACIERARRAGKRRLTLVSAPWMADAQRLYARFGFVRAAELDFTPSPEVSLRGYALTLGGRALVVLGAAEVEALLDRDALVDALADAMRDLSAGAASVPPRASVDVAGRGFLLAMAAHLPSRDALATKLVTFFTGNAPPMPTHQALVLVFDAATGAPVALLDGDALTAERTAAGSALATRLLARRDAGVLAVLGTGVQALAHGRAVPRVLPGLRAVRVAGRDPGRAARLAERLAGELAVPVEPAPDFRRAVEGADVVCATTHSTEPVVRREWLGAGAHVTSVGYARPGGEIDAATYRDALVVVESRASALDPVTGANDLVEAIAAGGRAGADAELGELVAGAHPGRTADDQLTLYKSVGVAVQDAAAAALVLAAARASGAGRVVEL
jgi:alanine dehydrogenase